MNIAFGCLTNLFSRLDMALRQSEITGQINYEENPVSATVGLNKLLARIEAQGADVAALVHQDMSFRRPWLAQVQDQLSKLPDSWIVAGIIGKDVRGKICGMFHDTRIPLIFNTSDLHRFPEPAICFDECCILVNLHKGFRFDERLDGFDLYGTLCVLQAWEMGGTAWVIDSGAYKVDVTTPYGPARIDFALANHHCTRPFTWYPDEQFRKNFKWLWERYGHLGKVDSTALGVPDEKTDEAAA